MWPSGKSGTAHISKCIAHQNKLPFFNPDTVFLQMAIETINPSIVFHSYQVRHCCRIQIQLPIKFPVVGINHISIRCRKNRGGHLVHLPEGRNNNISSLVTVVSGKRTVIIKDRIESAVFIHIVKNQVLWTEHPAISHGIFQKN